MRTPFEKMINLLLMYPDFVRFVVTFVTFAKRLLCSELKTQVLEYVRPFQVTPLPDKTLYADVTIMAANNPAPSGVVNAYQMGISMPREAIPRQ